MAKARDMAREEHDREDLLAEATALTERVELRVDGFAAPVVIGFRSQGAASFYFGADPAFHFNSGGRLRRAFVRNLLYKAERGRLVSLDRRRMASQVQLVRHELDDAESERFLDEARQRLIALREKLNRGEFQRVGQHPQARDVVGRAEEWLARHAQRVQTADSARVQ